MTNRNFARGKNRLSKIEKRKKQTRALELFESGLGYREVAAAMGYKNQASVHQLIDDLLREMPVKALDAYRRVEDIRIEALMSVYMPLAMGGDVAAATYVDKLIGRRAKLMGINAPERAPVNENGDTVAPQMSEGLALFMGRMTQLAGRATPSGDGGDV